MSAGWTWRIAAGALVVSGCVDAPGASMSPGLMEMAAFAQLPPRPTVEANTGRPAEGAFYVDLRKGYDDNTQQVSDWLMDAGWLTADFSPHNVRFDERGMSLHITRRENGPTPYVSAEFQRSGFYGYGRYEVVMRAAKSPGIVSSFFTHTDALQGDPHSEIDLEFVGNNPRQVHTNYFSNGVSDAMDIDLGFDASLAPHVYAFEWLPTTIAWYVDGVELRRVEASTAAVPIPTASSRVIANIWAANKHAVEWVGEADTKGASALYVCMSHVPAGQIARQCSDTFAPPSTK